MNFIGDSNILLLLRAEIRRIAWDLGKHLTLFVSAAALLALFFYIFKDFVGGELATLDPELSKLGLQYLCLISSILSGAAGAVLMRQLRTPPRSILPVMYRVGSTPQVIRLHERGIAFLSIAVAALLALTSCCLLKTSQYVLCCAIAIAATLIIRAISSYRESEALKSHGMSNAVETHKTTKGSPTAYSGISDWRRHQVLKHKMPGKGLMKLGLIGALFIPLAVLIHTQYFLLEVTALAVGLVVNFGLIYAVAADLPGSWFEKQAGLTHEAWLKAWQTIANLLALFLLICSGIALILSPQSEQQKLIALPIIAAFAPWVSPSLILQIDGRARGTNLMVAVLVGVFIGTAMIATPWAALVVPLLKSQAAGYQNGRFYRA